MVMYGVHITETVFIVLSDPGRDFGSEWDFESEICSPDL